MNESHDTQQAHSEDGPRGNRATQSGVSPPVRSLHLFNGLKDNVGHVREFATGTHIREFLTEAGPYASKEACPLFSPGLFPPGRIKGQNPYEFWYVVGEHDGGQVGVGEVVERLNECGIAAFLYTSASHTPEHPRWRVVAPLQRPIGSDQYLPLLALLNGALGGCLAPESADLKRRWYYGRVEGAAEYRTEVVKGQPLDAVAATVHGIEPIEVKLPKPKTTVAASAPAVPVTDADIDRAISALIAIPNPGKPGMGYRQWLEYAMSLHAATGGHPRALDALIQWTADGQDEKTAAIWYRFRVDGGIGPGTLFKAAHDAGWVDPSRAPSIEGFEVLVQIGDEVVGVGEAEQRISDAVYEAHLAGGRLDDRHAAAFAALPADAQGRIYDVLSLVYDDDVIEEVRAVVARAQEAARPSKAVPAAPWLADLPNVVSVPAKVESAVHLPAPFRGLMAGAVSAALAVAPKPQPALTTLAALIGMAACIPGHYRLPSGARMNLYGLAAAETGAGKDLPRNVARAIAHAGGAVEIGRPASGQGLEDSLIAGRPMLCEIDEIGHVLKAVNDSKAPPHLVELTRTYLALYSASSNRYNCRVRANGKPGATSTPRVIENPCVSLLGFSTPEKLGEAIGESSIEDGLLGRMLFVMGDADVEQRRVFQPFELPSAFKDYQAKLGQGLAVGSDGRGEQIVVRYGPGVPERLDVLVRKFSLVVARSPFSKALRARSFEKLERVAGVLAVFDAPRAPVMTLEHVEWATEFVMSSNAAIESFAADFMHGGQVLADAHRVLGIIDRVVSGEITVQTTVQLALVRKGLAPRATVLKASKRDKRRFDEAVEHLVATGEVEVVDVKVDERGRGVGALRRAGRR